MIKLFEITDILVLILLDLTVAIPIIIISIISIKKSVILIKKQIKYTELIETEKDYEQAIASGKLIPIHNLKKQRRNAI